MPRRPCTRPPSPQKRLPGNLKNKDAGKPPPTRKWTYRVTRLMPSEFAIVRVDVNST